MPDASARRESADLPPWLRRLVASVALCHVAAFGSLSLQLPGLFGHDGLVPFASTLQHAPRVCLLRFWRPDWPVTLDEFAGLLCLLGVAASTAAAAASLRAGRRRLRTPLLFVLLFVLLALCHAVSLSFFVLGAPFLSFQWDVLLLEATGITLAALLADSELAAWLPRLLLFKLMLMSGAVKVQARCPTWEQLTALDYHWATQPLPTPMAWHANAHTPAGLRRLSVAGTLALEGPLTWLLLCPLPTARAIGAWAQFGFQIVIASTGNYTFFNALTAGLALACAPAARRPRQPLERAASFLLIIALLFICRACFTRPASAHALDFSLLRLQLSAQQMTDTLATVLPWTAYALFFCAIPMSALRSARAALRTSPSRLAAARRCLFILLSLAAVIAYGRLLLSPLTQLLDSTAKLRDVLPVPSRLASLSNTFHLSGGYGLFRRMTGVGHDGSVARPELVIYGRASPEAPWLELPFRHKPGADPAVGPGWVAPHQPRLDWQMWFAALAPNIQQSGAAWLLTLLAKVLAGSPAVYALLSPAGPFSAAHPPAEVRVTQLQSRFSGVQDGAAWWVHSGERDWLGGPVGTGAIPAQYAGLTTPAPVGRVPWATGGAVWPAAVAAAAGMVAVLALDWAGRQQQRNSGREKRLKLD